MSSNQNNESLWKIYNDIKEWSDIEAMIGQQETVYLDFKQASDAKNGYKDKDRLTLAKSASGFGNERGGIIIWGIKCSSTSSEWDMATDVKEINNIKAFVARLKSDTHNITDPPVMGIDHKYIERVKGGGSGCAISIIPDNDDKPYQSMGKEGAFYGRTSSSFTRLPTHRIRQLVLFTGVPDLDVDYSLEKAGGGSGSAKGRHQDVRVIFRIINNGRVTTTHPFCDIKCDHEYKASKVDKYGDQHFKRLRNGPIVGGADTACHPGVPLDVAQVVICLYIDKRSNMPEPGFLDYNVKVAGLNSRLKEKVINVQWQDIFHCAGVKPCVREKGIT